MNARMQALRLHREIHQEKRKNAVLQRSRGLALQRAASSAPATPQVKSNIGEFFNEVNQRHRVDASELTKQELIVNMMRNIFVAPTQRRYSVKVMHFAMLMACISLPCYIMMRRFLILPNYSTLFRYFRGSVRENSEIITNITSLKLFMPEIVKQLTEHGDECKIYGGFIAVDAISLRPHIYVTREGFVEGLTTDEVELTSDELRELRSSYVKYEDFVRSLENKTITDSFVYVYQPLVAGTKCLPLLLDPSTQGKATAHEIDRLTQLGEILEEHGLRVTGYAFDGDSTYSRLHQNFFESYYQNLTSDTSFKNYSKISAKSIASDPLHLLKRGRYRLLSSRVHGGGFSNTTDSVILVDSLRSQLNLPSVVFSSERFTKMHDKLATRLFSIDTLASLFKCRNYTALSYFLPLCLLSVSLEDQSMTPEERVLFLEIGLYYMIGYYGMSKDEHGPLREFKQKNISDVRLFDQRYAREYCNTIVSILKVLFIVNGTVHLNSVGSNPVEHLFGMIRMRSKSVHTWEKMVREMSKVMLAKTILHQLGERQKIDRRLSYFAVNVGNDPMHMKITSGLAREIAFSLMCKFGFPVSVRDLMVWDAFSAHDLADDVFEDLRTRVLELSLRSSNNISVKGLSSTDASITSGTQILSRLVHRVILK